MLYFLSSDIHLFPKQCTIDLLFAPAEHCPLCPTVGWVYLLLPGSLRPSCACLSMCFSFPGVLPPQPIVARLLEHYTTPTHLRLSRLQIRNYFWNKQQMRLAGKTMYASYLPWSRRRGIADQVHGSVIKTSI